MSNASPSTRRKRAVESFKSASECIGPITPGLSIFAVTRGQWSMLDAILHCLDQIGPASVSLWTWAVASYEIEVLGRLRDDDRIRSGLLVIDQSARKRNATILADWRHVFGAKSVRYCVNHAKIATLETEDYKILLRGSMNLNFNPRFEQFDLTEGGEDFDLVKRLESELEILGEDSTGTDAYRSSRVADAFEPAQLSIFRGLKTWAK